MTTGRNRPPGQRLDTPTTPRWVARLFLFLAVATLAGVTPGSAQGGFPHDTHRGLFPLCIGCHDFSDADAAPYPGRAVCEGCHDGSVAEPVSWAPPVGAVRLDHRFHTAPGGVRLGCSECHRTGNVEVVEPADGCGECHAAHHAPGMRCRACHAGSPRTTHTVSAHAGCDGSGCHGDRVRGIAFDRELCLLCHTDMIDHQPGRACAFCHAIRPADG